MLATYLMVHTIVGYCSCWYLRHNVLPTNSVQTAHLQFLAYPTLIGSCTTWSNHLWTYCRPTFLKYAQPILLSILSDFPDIEFAWLQTSRRLKTSSLRRSYSLHKSLSSQWSVLAYFATSNLFQIMVECWNSDVDCSSTVCR